MSLVNDMLRDLDKRRQQPSLANPEEAVTPAPGQATQPPQTRWVRLAVLSVVVLAVVAGLWLYDNPQYWQTPSKPVVKAQQQVAKPAMPTPAPETLQKTAAKPEPARLLKAQWLGEDSAWRLQLTLDQAPRQRTEVSTSTSLQLQLGVIESAVSLPQEPAELISVARLVKDSQQLALELKTIRQVSFEVNGQLEQQGEYRLDVLVTPKPQTTATSDQPTTSVVKSTAPKKQPSAPAKPVAKPQPAISSAPLRKARVQTPAQLDQATRLQAQKLLGKRQLQQARELLETFVAEQPEAPQSRTLLAALLISQGQQERAAALVDQGLELSPEDAGLRKLKARLLIEAGQLAQASKLLATNPPAPERDSEYHQILAAALQADNQHQQAAEVYHGLLRTRVDQPAWWIGLARSLEALEQPEQAREAYQNVLKVPQLSPALADYARQRLGQLGG